MLDALLLTTPFFSSIKVQATVAATVTVCWSLKKRGDLGQLAPRKKLLKSC
jgi:hypothetical protein